MYCAAMRRPILRMVLVATASAPLLGAAGCSASSASAPPGASDGAVPDADGAPMPLADGAALATDGEAGGVDAGISVGDANADQEAGLWVEDAGSSQDAGIRDGASSDVGTDGSAVDAAAPPPLAISGHVVDDELPPQPVPGRMVTIVDAKGTKTQVTTDDAGSFTAAVVYAPYDTLVGPGAVTNDTPMAYLGLSTVHPRLMANVNLGAGTPRSAMLNLTFVTPACGDAGTCRVNEAVNGALGGGFIGGNDYPPSPALVTVPDTVMWTGSAAYTVSYGALVTNSAVDTFAVGTGTAALTDGVPFTTAPIPLMPVPVVEMTVNTSVSVGVASWQAPDVIAEVQMPGALDFIVSTATKGPSAVIALPDVSAFGGTGFLLATAAGTVDVDGNGFFEIFQSNVPLLADSTVGVVAQGPATILTPADDGVLSVSGTVTWAAAAPNQVFKLTLAMSASDGGAQTVTAWTSGANVALPRLAALGLVLSQGPSQLAIAGDGPFASLDAVVDEETLAAPGNPRNKNQVSIPITIGP